MSAAAFITQSEDGDFVLQVNKADGTGQDLTGWTLEWHIKSRASDVGAALIVLTTGSGIVHDADQVTNPGKAIASITTVQSAALAASTHVGDLIAIEPGGKRTYLITGSKDAAGELAVWSNLD